MYAIAASGDAILSSLHDVKGCLRAVSGGGDAIGRGLDGIDAGCRAIEAGLRAVGAGSDAIGRGLAGILRSRFGGRLRQRHAGLEVAELVGDGLRLLGRLARLVDLGGTLRQQRAPEVFAGRRPDAVRLQPLVAVRSDDGMVVVAAEIGGQFSGIVDR
ncbi:hypothetical protein NKH45_10465 [Mesorhizobium sp. M1156]|uniref:hypothetical protein n=1 Tax=Mesorhizobium sp. M1156 TaxID=2957064 RepID=UPI00333DD67F